MSLDNRLWGATKIHGELLKLGIKVAQSTVSIYMVPRRDRPLQTWKTFLRNHMEGIASIDLFVVPTIAFQQLSITSSARASSVAGTSRPSALAVGRLMTSSNLLACTTGRSAGLALSLLKIRFGASEGRDKQDRATSPMLRSSTLIAMMQAANLREGNNVIARAG
jgi:hypothetical protein